MADSGRRGRRTVQPPRGKDMKRRDADKEVEADSHTKTGEERVKPARLIVKDVVRSS